MNIYFAGSIRGGREDRALYLEIIQQLSKYGRRKQRNKNARVQKRGGLE